MTVMKLKINGCESIISFVIKYWLLLFTILMFFVFTVIEPRFASMRNVMDMLSSTCVLGLVGVGVTVVMCAGEIDFACGMELSMSAVLMAVILDNPILSQYYIVVLIAVLFISILFGALNAFLHVKVGIPSFIATMGTSLITLGLCKFLTNGGSFYSKQWPDAFTFLGQAYLMNLIPVTAIVLLITTIVMWIYTEKTRNGKLLYAVGSNPKACNYVGISVRKQKILSFIFCAFLCGFAGVVQSSQLNSSSPYMGNLSLINALTVLMLGATFLKMGVFNIPGTIVGSILFTIINFGLVMVGAPSFVKDFVQGGILLFAVSAVTIIKKKQNKSLG